jgi:hypothetical protein
MEEVDAQTQALAAMKLHANVAALIKDEVNALFKDYNFVTTMLTYSAFTPHLYNMLRNDRTFYDIVRNVILAVDHERSYEAKAKRDALQRQVGPQLQAGV